MASKLITHEILINRHMCLACLLWQKKYFKVGKQIATEDMYTRLAKKGIFRILWLEKEVLLSTNLTFRD